VEVVLEPVAQVVKAARSEDVAVMVAGQMARLPLGLLSYTPFA